MNIRFRVMDRVLPWARVMVIHWKRVSVRDKVRVSAGLRLCFN